MIKVSVNEVHKKIEVTIGEDDSRGTVINAEIRLKIGYLKRVYNSASGRWYIDDLDRNRKAVAKILKKHCDLDIDWSEYETKG